MSSLGEVVATARRAKGLTQEQLADQVGVAQAALSRYEKDLRTPEPEVLTQLAAAFGVTESFLLRASSPAAAMAVDAHMRRRATAKPSVWRRLEAQLNMLRMHSEMLREEVSLATQYALPSFDPLTMEPAHAAQLTRMQWRVPLGPVQSVTRWLESAGCVTIRSDMASSRVDGLSQWTADHPVIMVSATAPPDRVRWTLAHELGHLVMHREDMPPDMEDLETQADLFAGEFLMPESLIRPELRNLTLGKALDLKREWGVSMQAVIERAYRLGLLTRDRRVSLYRQLSARGWRINEPGAEDVPSERPELLAHIGRSLRAQGLKDDELASISGFASPTSNDLLPSEGLRAV